jgi:hypothetical protein
MNEKKFEILLYNNEKLEGTAYCRKHNMKCELKIKNKGDGVVLTYRVNRQSHFYTNLTSGKCKGCSYFSIVIELNDRCKIEVVYSFGRKDTVRLTPACIDNRRINYLESIKLNVKKEKIEYKK